MISVKKQLPKDCNDCKVKFKDGTYGIAYFGGGGSKQWATGLGIPVDKEIIEWVSLGNCDSIKHYNPNW